MHSPRYFRHLLLALLFIHFSGCNAQQESTVSDVVTNALYDNAGITVGAERMEEYLPLLSGKTIGLVVNQTSFVKETHLADTLLSLGQNVTAIFAPEHGFRGTADAGETVLNGRDVSTGLPILSLYGKNKKISPEYLQDIDLLIFDIQDVGARFYTYISTMHYVMEAAAENDIEVLVLDRPNPNGHYVSGPVIEPEFYSFVGMHTVPVVHGMTVGEYARMINGEKWLANSVSCRLTVIPCLGYDHSKFYALPIAPSPNLPNMLSVYLYPALCPFEGSTVSVGRGTTKQFQVLGSPGFSGTGVDDFSFTPTSMPGAKQPKHENVLCYGIDYSEMAVQDARTIRLAPAIYPTVYAMHKDRADFFTPFFDKLVGTAKLREAVIAEAPADVINTIYESGIGAFKEVRKRYLLYPDFE